MTQEQKDLLFKDLCARFPYNVAIKCRDEDSRFICYLTSDILREIQNDTCHYDYKPYLFPLSSMTEEQYDEMEKIVSDDYLKNIQITKEIKEKVDFITHFPIYCPNVIDWFNKNHFDYRGLIGKGLAVDVTNLNIY